jgi:hypothetical protein
MACERGPDVAEDIAMPRGRRLELAVELIGGRVEILAVGGAQPDARG